MRWRDRSWLVLVFVLTGPISAACSAEFLTLPCGPARPSESDWPCWRGPNHDGKSPDTGVQKHWPEGGPRLLWRVPGFGAGFSSPSVAGDRVFVTGELQGDLVASSLTLDGRILWQKTIDTACTPRPAGT